MILKYYFHGNAMSDFLKLFSQDEFWGFKISIDV